MAKKGEENDNNEEWPFWRRKKRKQRWPFNEFDELFGDEFEREFERMRKHLDELMEELYKAEVKPTLLGPFVYGFSMRIGADGKPQIQQFGSTPKKGLEIAEREPLTDVLEGEEVVTVTVELPGVAKEDIDLTATEDVLTIDVAAEKRKYHRDIKLPCRVLPDTTTATYKNGVLDIVIKRAEKKEKKPGKKVEIK
ncbi:MAG: Hsp20/alpha crystallin family protein [Candidatus Thermoplasmatota archaeon]|nr:Hsp20/alpha crystallin family protein [Candidatus Thermoplasmatota archaeon]